MFKITQKHKDQASKQGYYAGRIMLNDNEKLKAYAYGYYDGRVVGLDNNHYTDAVLRMAYDDGYEHGVFDYANCDQREDEHDITQ